MGQSENQPMQPDDSTRKLTQDLQHLQQSLVTGLSQDVTRLQAEKSRLLSDIQKLQAQQRSLQQHLESDLTQQQLQQQQVWAKQLAQALAAQLQALLVERIQSTELTAHNPTGDPQATARSIAALDATLNRIASSVNQDLSSYQSSLSQQLSRMHNLEQQGEAILEALVSRLNQQLQMAGTAPAERSPQVPPVQTSQPMQASPPQRLPAADPVSSSSPAQPARPVRSTFQTGLLLVLLSTIALSLHNVVVRIIGVSNRVFGFYDLGGFISLNLGNSMLILWMRMIIVLPLMIILGSTIYPAAWRDIRAFLESRDRSSLAAVTSSGFCLFLSQVLIYIAIGQVGPGVAVTILFMYPLITVPLAWLLFRDRPTSLRIAVMVMILSGVVLTAFPKLTESETISWVGVFAAVAAGISFACYLIAMQLSFRKLHPVPVSIIQFSTIFVLTSLSLILIPTRLGLDILPEGRLGLIGSGVLLGVLTLVGYLLNNYGVRYLGAARASIIASSGPVLTALLAFAILPGDPRNALQMIQWLGISIVTLGVLALSFEKLLMQRRSKPVG